MHPNMGYGYLWWTLGREAFGSDVVLLHPVMVGRLLP